MKFCVLIALGEGLYLDHPQLAIKLDESLSKEYSYRIM